MYSIEKTKGISYSRQFDYPLFILVIMLSVLGMLVLSSVSKTMGTGILIKQGVGLGIGIVLAIVLTAIDYKDFKVIGIIFYVISIALLVYVHFKGTGRAQWGSNSWIQIPVFGSLQPSELAKITFIMIVAMFLERIKEGQGSKIKNIIKMCIYAVIPIGLVVLEPDYGMTMVFVFIFCVMIFAFGLKYRYILGTLALSVPVGLYLWFFKLNEKRKSRIFVFLNPEAADEQSTGYHIVRSIRTIGSGQLFGKGLGKGIQTQRSAVPVKESDFIFTVVGEELGFIGTMAVLLLALFLLLRFLYIAKNSRDLYGSYLVIGMTAMIGFQYIQNIGMCIGLLPITGLPLPFISAGGSSMIANYIAIGIVLSVSLRRKKTIFNSSQ